jgi:hypothetical protein
MRTRRTRANFTNKRTLNPLTRRLQTSNTKTSWSQQIRYQAGQQRSGTRPTNQIQGQKIGDVKNSPPRQSETCHNDFVFYDVENFSSNHYIFYNMWPLECLNKNSSTWIVITIHYVDLALNLVTKITE